MKNKSLFAKLAIVAALTLGAVNTASANPFWGDDSTSGQCFAGVQPVYHHYYVFWIEVGSGVSYEAC